MKQVLEMIFKNLGEWVYLADVEEMVGLSNGQNAVDQLLNKKLIKYCGCGCGGFMITPQGIKHLEGDDKEKLAIWKTQDGLNIRVTNMSNEHLANAINWLLVEQTSDPEESFSDLTDEYQGVMIGTWLQILSQELYNRLTK